MQHMIPRKRWEILCERAANEQDPEKFFELIKEVNNLLEEQRRVGQEHRLSGKLNSGNMDFADEHRNS